MPHNLEGRTCNKCSVFKPWGDYSLNSKGINGRKSVCKSCSNKQQRSLQNRRKREDPVKFAEDRYNKNLKYALGLSTDDYEKLLEVAGNRCQICGSDRGARRLSVDHCHETGKIRGLLCHLCNTAIGKLGDNSQGVYRAYDYLLKAENGGEEFL